MRWAVVAAIVAFAVGGFGVGRMFDGEEVSAAHEQRDLYKGCLESGILTPECQRLANNAPLPKQPAPKIQYVPVPDPQLMQKFGELEKQIVSTSPQVTVAPKFPMPPANLMTPPRKLHGILWQETPPTPKSSSPSISIPGNGNAITFGQQGGTTIGTVVTGQRPPRQLDGDGEQRLLALLPPTIKEIDIQVLSGEGSQERANLAQQIQTFLTAKGYNVKKDFSWFLPVGPLTPGVTVIPGKDNPPTVTISVNENA